MPVWVNPFDPRPSFARVPLSESAKVRAQDLEKSLKENFPGIGSLTLLCTIGSMNLLVMFPAILITGFFPIPWRIPLAIAASVQIAICIEVFLQGVHWRQIDRNGFWRQYLPLLLNPIAALRSGDVLLKAASECFLSS
jgi:hypothetical protein